MPLLLSHAISQVKEIQPHPYGVGVSLVSTCACSHLDGDDERDGGANEKRSVRFGHRRWSNGVGTMIPISVKLNPASRGAATPERIWTASASPSGAGGTHLCAAGGTTVFGGSPSIGATLGVDADAATAWIDGHPSLHRRCACQSGGEGLHITG